ncbi:MAG: hypothetical protein QM809_13275 [Gordonia sp. (in: high G+C Gram-positive bacteria)]|uniref:hypothetical protein n=1 Tax=Gordonia sp. (in: high G+C Gram-positive bacteria) TaxID=84139 RepID=UPI0039E2EAD4
MRRRNTPTSTVKAATLDRVHVGSRTVVVLGPVRLPDPDFVRDRLCALADLGPTARLGLRPDSQRRHWLHDPESIADAVSVEAAPDDPGSLLSGSGSSEPFCMTLAGDHLRTEHDHGLGEVQLALLSHLLVIGDADPADPALRAQIGANGDIVRAALRTFATDPRRIPAVLTQTRAVRWPDAEDDGIYPARGPVGPAAAQTSVLTREKIAALRRWRSDRALDASMMTLVMCGFSNALAAHGVVLDQSITVTVDLRRYLPAGANPLNNVVSSVCLPYPRRSDPATVHRQLAAAVKSGRPLAAAVRSVATIRAREMLGRWRPVAADGPVRAHLTFAGVHELPQFSRFDWIDPEAGGCLVRSDPGDPAGILLDAIGICGGIWLSASHHPTVIPTAQVEAAISGFAADPISYLN